MRFRLQLLLLCLVLVGTLALLWHKTQGVDVEAYQEFEAALRDLQRYDRTLNQDVLRSRFQLLNTYDPIVQSQGEMRELRRVLALHQGALEDPSGELRRGMERFDSVLNEKWEAVETFKSRNSVLKNSLRYLPSLGTELASELERASQRTAAERVRSILQQTLIYNQTSDVARSAEIRDELLDLEHLATALPKEEAGRVRLFSSHVETVLHVKLEVDGILAQIFDAPMTAIADHVAEVSAASFSKIELNAARYRVPLYVLCIALIALVLLGVQRLRHSALLLAQANAGLEKKFAERTLEIDRRNQQMRSVLDNVEQGLISVGADGVIPSERSRAFDAWFSAPGPDTTVWQAFEPFDPTVASWLELGWESLRDGFLPVEFVLGQLPRRAKVNGLEFGLEYRNTAVPPAPVEILVVISDRTDLLERQRALAEQEDAQPVRSRHARRKLPRRVLGRRQRTLAEHRRARGFPRGADHRAPHPEGQRGNLRGHELGQPVPRARRAARREDVTADEGRARRPASGLGTPLRARERHGRRSAKARRDLRRRIRRAEARRGLGRSELLRKLAVLEREPAERRLARLAEQARALARRLGKGELSVEISSSHLRLDAARWAPLWSSFAHLLRNAIDHGIESAAERSAAGKPSTGRLAIALRAQGNDVIVELSDDGRGIDWSAVADKARELELPHGTQAELTEALFHNGLTTRSAPTEYSGRGAGLSAVREACRKLGGSIRVESELGRGTRVQLRIPQAQSPSSTEWALS